MNDTVSFKCIQNLNDTKLDRKTEYRWGVPKRDTLVTKIEYKIAFLAGKKKKGTFINVPF